MVDIYPKVEVVGAGLKGYCKLLLQNLNLTGKVLIPYATGASGANYTSFFGVGSGGTRSGSVRFVTLSNIKGKIIPIPPYVKLRGSAYDSSGNARNVKLRNIKLYLQKYVDGSWENIVGVELSTDVNWNNNTHYVFALPSVPDEYEISNQLGLYMELTVYNPEPVYVYVGVYHTVGSDDSYLMLPIQI